ncbi:FecR domain-containing protein [Hydrogenophaga sp.]|uniref:FecR domain-containing protein n=1 Tax=Hydrogenophaga sp. TaxID=1904254 RepID=UPI00262BBB97|nr:FecR domain-containing protein [Hydrogenophaga sp.]MCW5655348.1 FecR domain-containing protein [Hydrogenophaga sp.]
MVRHRLPRPCLSPLWIGAWLLVPGLVLAQQDVRHTVQPGDNLHDLARRYLEDPRQWPRLQALNQIRHPRRLQPGTTLVIPAALARTPMAPATVLHVAGPASVQHDAAPGATALAAGQRVPEGARIDVGDGGFVTLQLADGSQVRLSAGTQTRLTELRHAPAPGHSQSRIELERGRVDATVTPLPTPRSRFEIRTRRAVGGVRGTTFGVASNDQGDFIGDVREGAIDVRGSAGGGTALRAGEGARVDASGTTLARLLPPPDLGTLPAVVEDIAVVELPLPRLPSADGWQVRIAAGDDPQKVVRNGLFTQSPARLPGLEDGSYLVSVRALDPWGIPGGAAEHALVVNARPVAPLLREPQAGARLLSNGLQLACTDSTEAIGYRFQIARDAAFRDVVEQTTDLGTCLHRPALLQPGNYLWRVAAVARTAQGERDQGPFSRAVPFSVVAQPPTPGAPSSRSGANALHVAWSASPGGPWRHQIQLAQDERFSRILDDQRLDEPSYTRGLPTPGLYHLRVRQIDAEGFEGPWSPVQRLDVPARITTSDQQPLTNSEGQPVQPGTR